MLVVLAVLSLGLARIGSAWHEQGRREREREILRIGSLYATAIGRYYHLSPGAAKSLPDSLASLLEDKRGASLERHLRRLYPDPTMPGRPWLTVLSEDGKVRGVYIESDEPPVRSERIAINGMELPASQRYRDWIFAPNLDEP